MADDEEVYGDEMVEEQLEDDDHKGEGEAAEGDDLPALRAKLAQMEEEAEKLKAIQAKVQEEAGLMTGDDSAAPPGEPGSREEADARSIYVGNVDYACTPEELQVHFQSCGTVNRVTILTDKFGQAKGFAYVEFLEADAVEAAVLLNDSELRGRQIKVSAKRTNVPGLKMGRGRGRGRGRFNPYGRGGYGRGYGGGYYAPRGRRGRGRGYY